MGVKCRSYFLTPYGYFGAILRFTGCSTAYHRLRGSAALL